MTDDELLAHVALLCDNGERLPYAESIERPRLRTIIRADYAFQARFLVPALLELIERRGLRAADCCAICGKPATGLALVVTRQVWREWCGDPVCREKIR